MIVLIIIATSALLLAIYFLPPVRNRLSGGSLYYEEIFTIISTV